MTHIDGNDFYCKTCGQRVVWRIKKRRGNPLTQILLFVLFIVPGIVYTIYRLTGDYEYLCPYCMSSDLQRIGRDNYKWTASDVEKIINQEYVKKSIAGLKQQSESPRVPEESLIDEESSAICPSVEEFLRHYHNGNYYEAIGVSKNASPQGIRDAIDSFEMEHADTSSEWGVLLAKVREMLLRPEGANESLTTKTAKKPRPALRGKAEAVLAETDRLFDLGQLERALEKCNEAINVDPSFARGYSKRGHIHRVIGYSPESAQRHIDLAIEDYSKAIEMEPANAELYMSRGACYAQKGDLEKSIPDYGKSLELNPANTFAALGKLEAEICQRRYNDAMGTYGAWRRDATSPKDQVIGASLICIALALEGKPYEEYIGPLYDRTETLSESHDWCIVEIDRHLKELEGEGFLPDRVANAKEIQGLFKEHYV